MKLIPLEMFCQLESQNESEFDCYKYSLTIRVYLIYSYANFSLTFYILHDLLRVK